MGVTQATTITVVCDNPDCPGNDLDPSLRDGWLFISNAVYQAQPTHHVFCSSGCVSAFAAAVEAGTQSWVDGTTA